MKKKLLLVSAVTSLALGLMACTASNKVAGDTKTFVIGSMGPLTGSAAAFGTAVKNSAQIAVDEINEAGGVKVGEETYMLKLNFKDDEASEDKAVTAYNTLVDEGINVMMGATTSGASLAIADLTHKDGMLQITPSGSVKDITINDNVFRLCFTDPLQGELLANYVVDKNYKSVAVLYNNSDEYSSGVFEAFEQELDKLGKSDIVVAKEAFASEDIDFLSQLTKIKALNPDALFVPGYYGEVAQIATQAKTVSLEADLIGSDGWDGVLDQVTDSSVLDGAVFLSPFLASDPDEKIQKFVKEYDSRYKAIPTQFGADAYDTVYVIKAAMEEAGSVENADLIKAMTKIEVEGLTGKVSFSADGEPNKVPKFVGIQSGEYIQK